MTQTTPDPITTQERVLVRSTATGFEQGIAATAGLFTAGPLGAIAAWGALRGLQGKWAPWTILGIVGAPACVAIQLLAVGVIGGAVVNQESENTSTATQIETIVEETSNSSVAKFVLPNDPICSVYVEGMTKLPCEVRDNGDNSYLVNTPAYALYGSLDTQEVYYNGHGCGDKSVTYDSEGDFLLIECRDVPAAIMVY
jgi:hypothetical protein